MMKNFLTYIYDTEKQLEKLKIQKEENKQKKYIPLTLDLNIIKSHLNKIIQLV